MADDSSSMNSTEYEKLTQLLVERIAARAPVATTRLKHNVVLPGRASAHQIDVLWEFTVESGHAHRVIFECRRKNRSLEQNDALAFKGVVEEVGFESTPTTGVMVHLTGFQLGARRIADTYGLIILEMRTPTDKDVDGRLMKIHISMTGRVPVVKDVGMDVSALLSDALNGPVLNHSLEIQEPSGRRVSMMDLLQDGELNPMTEPLTPLHRVTRQFEPLAVLTVSGQPAAEVRSISATVGEELTDPFDWTIGGRERLAWMVKNALGGERAWFTHDGKVHVTDVDQLLQGEGGAL
ncbi:hypothetical protein [Streptomyces drozdowiczii]|uniref:Restriction endonuclease type IV Mrr domain-containing protein n=1 Tax=Streptomyces drozdowiczii TaxID=202862 RepID=A0ABY6Q2R1_9ACTN|nr:hypothetical protein [Streptomyces drozdowiczii]MCX0241862.1 hypothetical protein [Streptomyces drozdowiczii]UZK58294.1 hypothetical protein NEH16_33215 [Streptomyces drozdowiczii]